MHALSCFSVSPEIIVMVSWTSINQSINQSSLVPIHSKKRSSLNLLHKASETGVGLLVSTWSSNQAVKRMATVGARGAPMAVPNVCLKNSFSNVKTSFDRMWSTGCR